MWRVYFFFFSSRRRHTRWNCDWSSDVCSSDLRAVFSNASRELGADPPVDIEPPRDVSAEVGSRYTRDEPESAPDLLRPVEPSADDAQRSDRRPGELKERRSIRVQVAVDVSHLGADVASAIAEASCRFARPVEPS